MYEHDQSSKFFQFEQTKLFQNILLARVLGPCHLHECTSYSYEAATQANIFALVEYFLNTITITTVSFS